MKFGMLHLFENPVGKTEHQIVHEQLDIMQAAEDLGFDSIWPAEHHFTEYGYCVSPALVLAAIGRATKRIRLGTGVVVLPFHNPIRVAEEYALLDLMTDGRLDFGVGRGYQPGEMRGYGIDQARTRDIFRESLDVIVQAWTHDRVNYQGEFFSFDDVPVRPKPLQKPHPPIWMAALSPETFALVGKFGANLLYSPTFTPEGQAMTDRIQAYRQALRDGGHDPATKDIAALRMIYVAESNEQARRDFAEPVVWYYHTIARYVAPPPDQPAVPTYETYPRTRDFAASLAVETFDSLVEAGAVIAGDPDYCIERIEQLEQTWGFTKLLCWTRLGGMDHDKVLKSMNLMEKHVIPHFKRARTTA